MKVLVACEFSGIVREAFKKKGHNAWSCDLLPTEIEGNHIQGDVLEILNDGWDLMIAHPPCTFLTVTANKWMKPEFESRFPTRKEDRKKAIEFFMQLINAPIEKICVENPVGIMSTVYQKPSQIVHPYFFGHKEPKKTCLWLKNLPLLTSTDMQEPEYVTTKSGKRMPKWCWHDMPSNSQERTKFRNRTFQGIADTMAEQWG